MKTRSNRKKRSPTRKVRPPSVKILNVGTAIYGAKKYRGDEILKFTRDNELKKKKACLLDNISWFSNYKISKVYMYGDIYNILNKWRVHTSTTLININKTSEPYIRSLFLNNKDIRLQSIIPLSSTSLQQIGYDHVYTTMNMNERAYYEFCFAFGYMDINEQYGFMKLLEHLLRYNYMDMYTVIGVYIHEYILIQIPIYNMFNTRHQHKKYNRLSIYPVDKCVILNICKLLHANDMNNISGCIYTSNTRSLWFYLHKHLKIQDIILFNPHHHLIFDKVVE